MPVRILKAAQVPSATIVVLRDTRLDQLIVRVDVFATGDGKPQRILNTTIPLLGATPTQAKIDQLLSEAESFYHAQTDGTLPPVETAVAPA